MALKLKGSTSGFVALDAPSVAGNNTLTLPENNGSAHQILANDITAGVTTFTQVTVSRNGDLTVPGTISIGGTLTYEDVTSVDSVGIVTARGLSIFGNTSGLQVTSGISTFQAITATTGTFSGDVDIVDKIVHTGDTNTSIRFPGNDTFTVETGGSERVRVNDIGMGVGITPVKALNVVVGSGTTELIRLSQTVDASVQQEFGIGWCSNNNHDHPGAKITSQEYDVSDTRRSLVFYTRGTNQDIAPTERVRITSGGYMGIGVANPTTILHVRQSAVTSAPSRTSALYLENNANCEIQFVGNSSNDCQLRFGTSSNSFKGAIEYELDNNNLIHYTNGTEKLRITSAGVIVVGHTAATTSGATNNSSFNIVGNIGSATGEGQLNLWKRTAPSADDVLGQINFCGDTSGDPGAVIKGECDVAWDQGGDTSDHAGRLTFFTVPDNSSVAAERLRITSGGDTELRNTVSSISNSYSQYLKFRTTQTNGQSAVTGQIAGQGKSSWGGDLVFSTKPANSTPNDTLTERLRIDSSGRLLLGHTSSQTIGSNSHGLSQLNVTANQPVLTLARFENAAAGPSLVLGKSRAGSAGSYTVVQDDDGLGNISFAGADGTDLVTVGAQISAAVDGTPGSNDMPGRLVFSTTADGASSPTERVRITSAGYVGMGVAAPEARLHVSGNGRFNNGILINTNAHHNSGKFELKGHSTGSHTAMRVQDSSGSEVMKLRCDGYFIVSGSVNGNTKNFSIPHPIESLSSTKKLVHASIESPQLDLIYRGKVDLVGGTATVNIDSVSNMTDGTFVVLNRNIQCFTTNETGWGAVKGSVSGNILTITAQDNSSTDTISWMVIGERQDPNIITSTITDDDGYLIVEPEKVDES